MNSKERRLLLRTGATAVWERHDPEDAATSIPIVLIPGVSGTRQMFDSLAPRLARDRVVLSVDLVSHREKNQTEESSAARDLEEILAWEQLDEVDLLGQSFGSLVAMRLAARHPRRVRHLVLAPPAVFPPASVAAPILFRWGWMGALIRLTPPGAIPRVHRWIAARGGYPPEPDMSVEEMRSLRDRIPKVDLAATLRRLRRVPSWPWRESLQEIGVPTLILEGDREMELIPDEIQEVFESHPGTRLEVVPGGHVPYLSQPEPFERAVTRFCAEPARVV